MAQIGPHLTPWKEALSWKGRRSIFQSLRLLRHSSLPPPIETVSSCILTSQRSIHLPHIDEETNLCEILCVFRIRNQFIPHSLCTSSTTNYGFNIKFLESQIFTTWSRISIHITFLCIILSLLIPILII